MRFLLILLFSFSSFLLFAQRGPVDVNWGKEYKEPRNSILTEFIGKDATGFYALRQGVGEGLLSKEGSIFIERYNKKMNLIISNEVKLSYKNKDLTYEGIELVGDDLLLFTSFKNRKKKIHYIFSQTISKKSLKPRADFQILTQMPTKNQFISSAFSLEFSRDSTKMLVFSQLPNQNRTPEKYQITVLNQEMETLWEKNIQLPYDAEKFSINEYRVDNEGNVFVLGKVYKEGTRNVKRGKPNYQYTLLTYSNNGSLAPEYKIDLEDKFITDLTFRIQKNGDPVCAGFYSDNNSYSVRGTYFFKIDKKTGDVYNINLKEFSFEFLTELMNERRKKRAEKIEKQGDERRQIELNQYSLDRLVLRTDGGAVLVAEQYYVTTQNDRFRDARGFWQYRSTMTYHYNNIIVVNINPSGEIDWASHVPKRQITTSDGGYFSSYALAVTNKAIYMVFNDNGKNFDKDKEKHKIHSYNGSRSVVTLAEVKPNGTVTKFPLFNNKEEGIITRPKVCRQTDSDEIVIYGEKNRRYKFASVLFN